MKKRIILSSLCLLGLLIFSGFKIVYNNPDSPIDIWKYYMETEHAFAKRVVIDDETGESYFTHSMYEDSLYLLRIDKKHEKYFLSLVSNEVLLKDFLTYDITNNQTPIQMIAGSTGVYITQWDYQNEHGCSIEMYGAKMGATRKKFDLSEYKYAWIVDVPEGRNYIDVFVKITPFRKRGISRIVRINSQTGDKKLIREFPESNNRILYTLGKNQFILADDDKEGALFIEQYKNRLPIENYKTVYEKGKRKLAVIF